MARIISNGKEVEFLAQTDSRAARVRHAAASILNEYEAGTAVQKTLIQSIVAELSPKLVP